MTGRLEGQESEVGKESDGGGQDSWRTGRLRKDRTAGGTGQRDRTRQRGRTIRLVEERLGPGSVAGQDSYCRQDRKAGRG